MKVDVTVTPRSFMESTEDIAVPPIRVRGKGGGPPMATCEHFATFSGRSESFDHCNAAYKF